MPFFPGAAERDAAGQSGGAAGAPIYGQPAQLQPGRLPQAQGPQPLQGAQGAQGQGDPPAEGREGLSAPPGSEASAAPQGQQASTEGEAGDPAQAPAGAPQGSGPLQALAGAPQALSARIGGFEDFIDTSFGFRRQLIALDAAFRERAFGESSNGRIVIGRDGWLFLAETLDAGSAANSASERMAARIARTLALQREYLESCGTGLLVAVAPNKARVYGEYLPYYAPLSGAGGEGLLGALNRRLGADGVPYADLAGLFAELKAAQEGAGADPSMPLADAGAVAGYYHKLDTHWNYLGAIEAYRKIMGMMADSGHMGDGFGYDAYEGAAPAAAMDWQGDLEAMLNPVSPRPDTQYRYAIERAFRTRRPLVNEEDLSIVSSSGRNGASVLFFRDSFANSLIQFFSNNLGGAEYLRAMPYQLARAEGGAFDMAVVEIVERNLPLLVDAAPAVPAPARGAGEIARALAGAPAANADAGAAGAQGQGQARAGSQGQAQGDMAEQGQGQALAEAAPGGAAAGDVAAWLAAPGADGNQSAYAHIYGFFSPRHLSPYGETRVYAVFEPIGAGGAGAGNAGSAPEPQGGAYAFEAYPILEEGARAAAAGVIGGAAAALGAEAGDCGFSLYLDDGAMPDGIYRASLLFFGEDGAASRSGGFMEYRKDGAE
ncbi:MAG: hypothetical protein LBJ10_03945 [Clostridiales bacterium]|jgi:hypothetical protein|nr:hypothetical protein [Clostridiales bacterium]